MLFHVRICLLGCMSRTVNLSLRIMKYIGRHENNLLYKKKRLWWQVKYDESLLTAQTCHQLLRSTHWIPSLKKNFQHCRNKKEWFDISVRCQSTVGCDLERRHSKRWCCHRDGPENALYYEWCYTVWCNRSSPGLRLPEAWRKCWREKIFLVIFLAKLIDPLSWPLIHIRFL